MTPGHTAVPSTIHSSFLEGCGYWVVYGVVSHKFCVMIVDCTFLAVGDRFLKYMLNLAARPWPLGCFMFHCPIHIFLKGMLEGVTQKYYTHLKVFVLLGMAKPTAFVFCFLDNKDAIFSLGFLFLYKLALAHLRHRLTEAALVTANNCGLMSKSVMDEPVGVAGVGAGCNVADSEPELSCPTGAVVKLA